MVTDSASLPDLLKSFKSKSIAALEITVTNAVPEIYIFFLNHTC